MKRPRNDSPWLTGTGSRRTLHNVDLWPVIAPRPLEGRRSLKALNSFADFESKERSVKRRRQRHDCSDRGKVEEEIL